MKIIKEDMEDLIIKPESYREKFLMNRYASYMGNGEYQISKPRFENGFLKILKKEQKNER